MSANRRYPAQSYYDLLGVDGTATRGEIREACLRLAEEARFADPIASDRIDSVNDAYEILMDSAQRAAYDAYLSGARSPGVEDRNGDRTASTQKPLESAGRTASEATRSEPLATEQRRPTTRNLPRRGGSIIGDARIRPLRRRSRRRLKWGGALVAVAAIVVLIIQAVSRQNADNAKQAAESAAAQASLEQAARSGAVECFVVSAGSGTTQESVGNKHFPCAGVPLGNNGSGDSFWTVITVKGVDSEAASQYGIWLFCSAGESGLFTGRSDSPPEPGFDMRAFVAGTAGGANDALDQINCEVRANDGVIRTEHVAMALDVTRRFGS